MNKLKFTISAILLVIIFSSLFYLQLNKHIHSDEFESIHTAWKISHGEIIYNNFFQHHHPLFYYTLVPLTKIFNESFNVFIAARIYSFLLFIGIIYFSYLFSKNVLGLKFSILTPFIVLSSTMFMQKAWQIRPDVLQSFFAISSFYFLFLYFKNYKIHHIIISSILLALSFIALQKSIFLIIGIYLIFLFRILQDKKRIKEFLYFSFGFLATCIPFFMFIASIGFANYYNLNWELNRKFILKLPFWGHQNKFFIYDTIIILLSLVSIFFSKNKNIILKIYTVLFVIFSSILVIKVPKPQYFIIHMAIISILATFSIEKILIKNKYIGSLLILIIVSLGIIFGDYKNTKHIQTYQKELINYVVNNTSDKDLVYGGRKSINIFRNDLDYFWWSTDKDKALDTYQKFIGDYQYNIYKLIQEKKPKIISTFEIDDMNNPIIKNNYEKSPKYNFLYIKKNE